MMSKTPRAIVSVTNDLYTDNRVNKVCMFLVEQGYDVLLVGRKRKSSVSLDQRPYKTKRFNLRFETGAKFYAFFNLRLCLFLIFKRADLLVSNDLDTLLANYMASKLKPKCKLVYDSHEYFTEVPELINRPKVQKLWLSIEHYIFPKLKTVYTVNQSIADIYRKKYNTNVKVVRNISKRWNPKTILNKSELGIPEDKNLIILQGAGINVDRGAEEALEAMVHLDAVLMIVGDGDVVAQLKVSVLELELSKKVLFYGKKPYHIMMNYTHFADIGLTLDKPSNLNYQLSLPNKVFDYMHTQTAVVATDIKEVSAVIKKHTIGEILTEFTPETLAKKLANLFENPSLLNRYKDNCKIAANIENWETETEILNTIYPHV